MRPTKSIEPVSTDLAHLQELVDNGYQFTGDVYPHSVQVNSTVFGVQHSLLHMQKALGAIATELEHYDHGQRPNYQVVTEAVQKEFVNVLKLAAHIGVTADDLARFVVVRYGATSAPGSE